MIILFDSTAAMPLLSVPPVVGRDGSGFQQQLIRSMVEFIEFGQMQIVLAVIVHGSGRQPAAALHCKTMKRLDV